MCTSAKLERETLAFATKFAAQPREVVAAYQEIFRTLRAGEASRARELRVQAKARAKR